MVKMRVNSKVPDYSKATEKVMHFLSMSEKALMSECYLYSEVTLSESEVDYVIQLDESESQMVSQMDALYVLEHL